MIPFKVYILAHLTQSVMWFNVIALHLLSSINIVFHSSSLQLLGHFQPIWLGIYTGWPYAKVPKKGIFFFFCMWSIYFSNKSVPYKILSMYYAHSICTALTDFKIYRDQNCTSYCFRDMRWPKGTNALNFLFLFWWILFENE
jgi:hypothetical protein